MLKDLEYPESSEYRSGSSFEPIQFFLDALSESKKFDLLLGYFSSAAFSVLSLGFVKFLTNGGKMRMVINNILSQKDKDLLVSSNDKNLDELSFNDVVTIMDSLDEHGEHFFNCLAWLIKEKRIEIVVIKPVGKSGISHFKSGLFSDGKEKIKFTGSANFTAAALLENLEEVSVKRSWIHETETKAIDEFETAFENYFTGRANNIQIVPYDLIEVALEQKYGDKDLNELIEDGAKLVEKKRILSNKNLKLTKTLKKLSDEIFSIQNEPRFPYPQGPRDYQQKAYERWVEYNKKGIFAMATGTGKTITSLNCLLEEYRKTNSYYAIILVPSKALLEQWIEEVSQFNFSNVIVIGGGHDGMQLLPNYASNFKSDLKKDIIIISTYASFSSDKFLKSFNKIQNDFILIADEAHNMGASQIKKVMSHLTIPKRIGLSATPKRKYDPEGTDAICEFFNDQPPFCYSFGMKRAMKEGRLTDYYYYPRIVHLDEDEKEEYVELSNTLLRFFDFEQGKFKDSPIVESLLLRRKTIIHQARRKIPAYKEILKELDQRDKLKYVFTYVPVGSSREEEENNEDIANKFVYQYLKAAQEVKPNLRASTYTSETEDRISKIRGFSEGKIDMLLAMKMLDEGVDIPRTEVGIFASSTGNPREYIQRRGRLLRNHDEKKFAYVYDMIVAPIASHDNENLYRIERNMVRNELIRVAYFASLSMNFYESKDALQDICDRYELDLDMIINELEND